MINESRDTSNLKSDETYYSAKIEKEIILYFYYIF